MRLIKLLLICLLLWGCNHPESKSFERNQKAPNVNSLGNETEYVEENISNDIPVETPPEYTDHKNILKIERQNGVSYVWIEINGIRLRFIFDTGASNISISSAEATVLVRQGTLENEDILDTEYFQDATGKISEGTKINLRTVKIGDSVLYNVQATVIDNVNAPLLLGQSVIEKFGKVEIDNTNGEIIFK